MKGRDKAATLRFIRKVLKRHGQSEEIVTDGLRSYSATLNEINAAHRRHSGRWANNHAENNHLPFRRREAVMRRFRSMGSLQKFASVHASLYNFFNLERHLVSRQHYKLCRTATLTAWVLIAE